MEKKAKGKQKYDYAKLKQEFFQSDIAEVKEFFLQKYNQNTAINKEIAKNTKGWAKEKKAMKMKLTEKAIEKRIEKESDKLSEKIPLERLVQMKLDFFDLIELAIQRLAGAKKIDMDQIVKGLNAIKTELGEPTKVTQNTNKNYNEDISDEDKELISNYIKQKHGTGGDHNK